MSKTIEQRAKEKAKGWSDKTIRWAVVKELEQFAQEQDTITRKEVIDTACQEFDAFVDKVMAEHYDSTWCAAAKIRFRKNLLGED